MTFDEIVSTVKKRLNLTTADATTRVGEEVNERYRRVTASIGLDLTRRTVVQADTTPGVSTLTFTNIERISIIRNANGDILEEGTVGEIRRKGNPVQSDDISQWAPLNFNADSVQILMDVEPQSAITLRADGHAKAATLTGSQEPNFPESYHDILIHGVVADEFEKKEKTTLAAYNEAKYEKRLSELRLFLASSAGRDFYQGKTASRQTVVSTVGGSGGGSINGAASYTQTGLITFDRDPDAPFAVTSGSARVPNLRVDTNFLEVQVFS